MASKYMKGQLPTTAQTFISLLSISGNNIVLLVFYIGIILIVAQINVFIDGDENSFILKCENKCAILQL